MLSELITIGCVMAQESGQQGAPDYNVSFHCRPTTETATGALIVTPELTRLAGMGYSPVAIVRVSSDNFDLCYLCALNGLSRQLLDALENGADAICADARGTVDERG